jgi:hypothetical protein
MKSAYKIAKEIGITPQAIYKRLTPEFIQAQQPHVNEKDGKTLFDEYAEQDIKRMFNRVEQPKENAKNVQQPSIEFVVQPNEIIEQPKQSKNEVQQFANELVQQPITNIVEQPLYEIFEEPIYNSPSSLTKLLSELKNLDEKVQQLIVQPPIEPLVETNDHVEQMVQAQLNNHLLKKYEDDINFLKERNQWLEEEIAKEREHGRRQTDKWSEMTDRLADITRNQQVLLGVEQGINNMQTTEIDGTYNKTTEKNEKGWFRRLFKNRKSTSTT